ncbi:MAG: glycosyltransferase [Pyrinomonadaceae bacterium]|nr:glycosyltransferase [Pyrinomonadaceae bacterium]
MKIIRIIARLNVGGPARHVVWLSKEFQNEADQTVLIAGTVPPGEEDMRWFAEENGVSPVFVESLSRELSPKDAVSLWNILKIIFREKPDVIHTHTAKAGTIGRVAAIIYRTFSRRRIFIVHTFHGHIFHNYYGSGKTKIFLAIERFLARFASDRIVVISDQQFSEIHEKFGVGRREQFRVIPLGIDLEKFAPGNADENLLRDQLKTGEDEMLIGFVGRLTEIKNLPMLMRAAEILKNNVQNSRFVICGDGNVRTQLEDMAREKDLDGFLEFIGNREDIENIYAGLDIVALTSLNEGTPLSLIEAMAGGKAVISTAVGGVVDLLGEIVSEHDGFQVRVRGVSVESKDFQGFAAGLRFLIENSELRKDLGKSGLRFVQENYSKERLFQDIRELYKTS